MALSSRGPGVVDWGPQSEASQHPLAMPALPAVDEAQLYSDVKKLIFRDCRDTTTWDHLGNLEQVRQPEVKHVRIDPAPPRIVEDHIEFLDLPVGLGLLFDVATMEEFADLERRAERARHQ